MAIIMGAVVLGPAIAWLLWRSQGYKRVLLDRPPPGWVLTAEAFVDPSSREIADVWINPASGERVYVRRLGFSP